MTNHTEQTMKQKTKGMKCSLTFYTNNRKTKRTLKFTAGGRKRYELNDYDVMVNGEVILADGSRYYALLVIDETSSGELCDIGLFCINETTTTTSGGRVSFNDGRTLKIVWLRGTTSETPFYERLGKATEKDVHPFKYKYSKGTVLCDDIHVGDDGWSP